MRRSPWRWALGALLGAIALTAAPVVGSPPPATGAAALALTRAGSPLPWCDVRAPVCARTISVQFQERPTWCVPAAARAVTGGIASQAYLADLMSTGASGTLIRRIPSAVNLFTDRTYAYSGGRASFRDPVGLAAAVRYSVGFRNAPVILGVEGDLLPYWPDGVHGRHVIVLVGWMPRGISVWDPLSAPWNTVTGGFHVVPAEELAAASRANGSAMVAMIP